MSVLGEQYSEQPEIFEQAKIKLSESSNCEILNWGFVPSKKDYFEILSTAHVCGAYTFLHKYICSAYIMKKIWL